MVVERFDALVIGGGQAGLAMGWHLQQQGRSFAILEAAGTIGESWRNRWDTLRLFTPARYSGLPGMRFPGDDFSFPTKTEAADYLNSYARHFELPVRISTRVGALSFDGRDFVVQCESGRYSSRAVVVATGAYANAYTPDFARGLSPSVVQLHSSEYRNVSQLPKGDVLVVGAGNSGAEIAIEAAQSGRNVLLSGRDTGRIPADVLGRILGGRPYWWLINRVLSESTPLGRKVKSVAVSRGTPLIGVKPREIADNGVARLPRISGVADGMPCLEDGRTLNVAAVVWATGFRPDYSWIGLPAFDSGGRPDHVRGVSTTVPGLCFLGLHFQYSLASSLLGGVGNDAAYIAAHMARVGFDAAIAPAGVGDPAPV